MLGGLVLTVSKRPFANWYFEYTEAERKFLEAKRVFEMKRRDVCLFAFRFYSDWCKRKFGCLLRPSREANGDEGERVLDLFYAEFDVDCSLRPLISSILVQAFDENSKGEL